MEKQKTVLVTGAAGLLGSHACVRLHSKNCAAEFSGQSAPFEILPIGKEDFGNAEYLKQSLERADAVFHFAGVNRGNDEDVIAGNREITEALISAAVRVGREDIHVIYANSLHSSAPSPYGKSKREGAVALGGFFNRFTDVIIPHVFGEGARPNYNNVTATLIDDLLNGLESNINEGGSVRLMHAGDVAEVFIGCLIEGRLGKVNCAADSMPVPELASRLTRIHRSYFEEGVLPRTPDKIDAALFNCYRFAAFPQVTSRALDLKKDPRGMLFEAVRTEDGGQAFLSTTNEGVTRGNHFHLSKMERFLVVSGRAKISLRRVLREEVIEFNVDGDRPTLVDIPTMYTHNITNTGSQELFTLFWTNELFDPANPDTYSDTV